MPLVIAVTGSGAVARNTLKKLRMDAFERCRSGDS
jgi:hypothetical protein